MASLARLLCLLGCLFGMAPVAVGHELDLARFELGRAEVGDGRHGYRLLVLLPDSSSLLRPERLQWPDACELEDRQTSTQARRARLEITFSCAEPLHPDARLKTPWGQDGAVFTSHLGARTGAADDGDQTLVLAGRRGGVELPLGQAQPAQRPLMATARDYVELGMFHILEGWDHLAFVLCLVLLVRGRNLIWLVTAFTLGHSVSLALAYFGYLTLPMPPVEAVIALSVAFMAREAALQPSAREPGALGWRYPAVVTGFGLLHGLGFASELAGLGVSTSERVTGLLTFNLGVEVGQLLFVVLALLLLQAARLLLWEDPARRAALAAAGILGMYWFSERLWGLLLG